MYVNMYTFNPVQMPNFSKTPDYKDHFMVNFYLVVFEIDHLDLNIFLSTVYIRRLWKEIFPGL